MRINGKEIRPGGGSGCSGCMVIITGILSIISGLFGLWMGMGMVVAAVMILIGVGLIAVGWLHWFSSGQVTYCEKCDELFDYKSEEPSCPNCHRTAKNVSRFGPMVKQVRRKKELERKHIISEFKRKLEQWQSEGYDIPKLKGC